MFRMVESGIVLVPLAPEANYAGMSNEKIAEGNMQYLHSFLCNLLKNAFPHLNEYAIIEYFCDASFNRFLGFFYHTYFLLPSNSFSFIFSSAQIRVFVDGLFSFDQNPAQLKEHLRDFLVQIRVCVLTLTLSEPKSYSCFYAFHIR